MSKKKNKANTSKEVLELRRTLDALATVCEVEKDEVSRKAYNLYKEKYREKLTEINRNGNLQRIEKAENKTKEIWSIIKEGTGSKMKVTLPTNTADEVNKFFANIGKETSRSCVNTNQEPAELFEKTHKRPENSIYMRDITMDEIEQIVRRVKNKNTKDIYGISTKILKKIIPNISHPLSIILSRCMSEGYFPDQLKRSRVIPIYKSGDLEEMKNFRPISIQPTLAKILEHAIKDRMVSFFKKHNIWSKQQHGFLAGKSTTTALAEILQKIAKAMDEGKKCKLSSCDLSKAFDSIDHQLLLEKLKFYGIRGVTLDLVGSYLHNRYQQVQVGEEHSNWELVTCGVPQGSIMGPILFLVYVNDLPANVKQEDTVMFVDDASFLDVADNQQNLEEKNITTLEEAQHWFSTNKMKMNPEKTQTLCFSTKSSETTHLKFLGFQLQSDLKFSYHIEELSANLSKCIFAIRRMMQMAGKEAAKVAYFGLFQSAISYGVLAWGDMTGKGRIFIKQKRALRIICNARNTDSCRPLFRQESILTLTSLFILSCVNYVHDHKDSLLQNNFNHAYNTRNANSLIIPHHKLKTTQLSVNYLAIKIYNRLPEDYKKLKTKKLRNVLKKKLMQKAYYELDEYFTNPIC